MTDHADMHQAAKVAGKSYDRFRKIWPTLVRTKNFPAPFEERPYLWDPERLETWRAARSDARRSAIIAEAQPRPSNDDHPDAPPSVHRKGRAAAGRARLLNRMGAHA